MCCNEAERSNSPSALLTRSGAGRVARKRLRNNQCPVPGDWPRAAWHEQIHEALTAVWKTAGFFAQDDLGHSAAFLRDEKASVCKRGDAKVSGDGGIFCQHGCSAGVDERANGIKASRVSRIAPQRLFWREEILRLRSTAGR